MHDRHPLSAMCGDMSQAEYDELIASIEADSSNVAVTVYDGQVLDGWHRFTACRVAGVTPRFVEYDGDDPRSHVIRENVLRRHLGKAQRAAVVVRIRDWRPLGMQPGQSRGESGRLTAPGVSNDIPGETLPATTAQMAAEAGVSVPTINRAKAAVRREERTKDAGLAEHVKDGTLTAEQADDIVEAGLETSVLAGTTTPEDAADQAAGERAAARPLTRLAKAISDAGALRVELGEARRRIDDLGAKVDFYEGEDSEHAHEREAMFTRQQAMISALRSSVAELTTKHADLLGAHKGALRRLKKLDGQSREIRTRGPAFAL